MDKYKCVGHDLFVLYTGCSHQDHPLDFYGVLIVFRFGQFVSVGIRLKALQPNYFCFKALWVIPEFSTNFLI